MSSGNVDLVRSIYAGWERGDFSSSAWASPDIEFVYADGPEPGSSTGLVGMKERWGDYLGAWDDYRFEVDEYRELDENRVLVLIRRSGRGKSSGMAIQTKGAHLFNIDDGKVTGLALYWNREGAFADLGFSPEGGSS
jgi:ketosteroid isomerase-like protein